MFSWYDVITSKSKLIIGCALSDVFGQSAEVRVNEVLLYLLSVGCFILVRSAAGTQLQVKTHLKMSPQKRSAQQSPKKSSQTLICDVSSSLENSRVKADERKTKTDSTSSLSVDTSKVRVLLLRCY